MWRRSSTWPTGHGRASRADGIAIGEVKLGVMLEIPSAVLTGDRWFGRVAFASLGTNDLLQYTLAVDRGNPALERYRDPLHPAQLRLIRIAAEAARSTGIELSVCGEMAGDPAAALALVGLGDPLPEHERAEPRGGPPGDPGEHDRRPRVRDGAPPSTRPAPPTTGAGSSASLPA